MLVDGKHIRRDGTPMVLLIDTDWPVTDLPTATSCDAAEAVLAEAITKIETALATKAGPRGAFADAAWFKRAGGALRMKRAAMRAVQKRRAELLSAETQAAS